MSYTREVVELDDDEKAIDHTKQAISCFALIKIHIRNRNQEDAKRMASIAAFWARKAMMRNHVGSNISIEEMISKAKLK